MGKDEAYVQNAFQISYITEEEKPSILATPQL